MDVQQGRRKIKTILALLTAVLLLGGSAVGSVTASMSGTVKDATGAAVPGATVTAKNVETGITQTLSTNDQGYYSFPTLSLGHYELNVQQAGFRPFHETGLLLEVNSVLTVDVTLQVGDVKETSKRRLR
jgi:hypothetical protein